MVRLKSWILIAMQDKKNKSEMVHDDIHQNYGNDLLHPV